jgi:hypothetical protein
MVTERNWLDVFTWATWGGNANLPHFVEGQTFLPSELALRQGATQPPPRLSERDLIAAMERYGIGTDATVAGGLHLVPGLVVPALARSCDRAHSASPILAWAACQGVAAARM